VLIAGPAAKLPSIVATVVAGRTLEPIGELPAWVAGYGVSMTETAALDAGGGDGTGDRIAKKRWVRDARRAAGLTQMQLAELLSVSTGRVAQWESPRYPAAPNGTRLAQIAHVTTQRLPDTWLSPSLSRRGPKSTRPEILPQGPAACVTDEILAIATRYAGVSGDRVHRQRDAAMLAQRYGTLGPERATLQSCGDAHGLTRERARQITERMLERARAFGLHVVHPHVDALAEQLRRLPAMTLEDANTTLRPVLGGELCLLDARRFANEVLARDLPFALLPLRVQRPYGPEVQIVVPGDVPRFLEPAVTIIKRLVRHSGAAQLTVAWALTQQAVGAAISLDEFRQGLILVPGLEWLVEPTWFWLGPEGSANRVVDRALQILAVAPSHVDIEEIYAGIMRYMRTPDSAVSEEVGFLAPMHVVATILKRSPEFRCKQGDDFGLAEPLDATRVLTGSPLAVYEFVRSRGGITSRKELKREFLASRKLNPVTLSVTLAIAPILRQVDRGIFALRGWPIDGKRLRALQEKVGGPKKHRVRARPDGFVAWEMVLTANTWRNGQIFIPSTLQSLIPAGDYRLPDKGRVRVRGGAVRAVSGVVSGAKRMGLAVNDRVEVAFNTREGTVSLRGKTAARAEDHHGASPPDG
jgi:transcriptional regulator with XRE-family HTH domain